MPLFAHVTPNSGFLPTRASFMLDAVFLAMFLVVPVMFWSIRLAKQGKFALHKKVQLATALVLLVAVIAFEVDMRLNGWLDYTHGSAYTKQAIMKYLYIHLAFAIPTPLLWIVVIVKALRKFPKPPIPGEHSKSHKRLGWIATIGMVLTSVTGWTFYYVAFVSSFV